MRGKCFRKIILITLFLNLIISNSILTFASTQKKADLGVDSCKGISNESVFMWGKIPLTYKDYYSFSLNFAYKITTLEKVTMYEQAVDEYRITVDKVIKVKDVEAGKEFFMKKGGYYSKKNVDGTLYYVIEDGQYLIKVDDDLVKAEKPSEKLLSTLYCAKKDNDVKDDPLYEKGVSILNEIINPNMSEFDQVKAINDYVINHTTYDLENFLNDTIPSISYTKEGVFNEGIAVCDGYTKATEFLLTIYGFRNEYVSGTAKGLQGWDLHSWNAVKVNGEWYMLDTTWNDSDNKEYISYDYFLISEQKLSKDHQGYFEYKTDNKFDRYFDLNEAEKEVVNSTETIDHLNTSDYNQFPKKEIIDIFKSWTITFNRDLDEDTFNHNNVFLIDEASNRLDVTLQYTTGSKEGIIYAPALGYKEGIQYTLIITKGIKTKDDIPLQKGIMMNFELTVGN